MSTLICRLHKHVVILKKKLHLAVHLSLTFNKLLLQKYVGTHRFKGKDLIGTKTAVLWSQSMLVKVVVSQIVSVLDVVAVVNVQTASRHAAVVQRYPEQVFDREKAAAVLPS